MTIPKDWSQGRDCLECEESLPLEAFYVRNSGIPYPRCIPCQAIYIKRLQERRVVLPDDAKRTCARCEESKVITDFPRNRQSAGGYLNLCKPCYSAKVSMYKYGVVLDHATHCDICREPLERGRNKIAVDHDHACCPTKANSCGDCVRGILCAKCNVGLGMFRDNPEYLRLAAEYLEAAK